MADWELLKTEVRDYCGVGLPDAACKAIIKKLNEKNTVIAELRKTLKVYESQPKLPEIEKKVFTDEIARLRERVKELLEVLANLEEIGIIKSEMMGNSDGSESKQFKIIGGVKQKELASANANLAAAADIIQQGKDKEAKLQKELASAKQEVWREMEKVMDKDGSWEAMASYVAEHLNKLAPTAATKGNKVETLCPTAAEKCVICNKQLLYVEFRSEGKKRGKPICLDCWKSFRDKKKSIRDVYAAKKVKK